MPIEVRGFDVAIARLDELGSMLPDVLEAGTKAGALIVQNAAKDNAPYRSGDLRRSIHMEVTDKSSSSVTVIVGTDKVYAAAQEFGWPEGYPGLRGSYEGHPYLRPAFDENADAAREEVARVIEVLIAKVVAG
jgi:HK97 gp10 family phage protein